MFHKLRHSSCILFKFTSIHRYIYFFLFITLFLLLLCCRSRESVDMDEIMAAMVLTSLSCSPVIQSPTQRDSSPRKSSSPKTKNKQKKDIWITFIRHLWWFDCWDVGKCIERLSYEEKVMVSNTAVIDSTQWDPVSVQYMVYFILEMLRCSIICWA